MQFDGLSEEYVAGCPLLEDKYRLTFTLGKGRYGQVYQAIHLPSFQRLAVKVLPSGIENEEPFLNEVAMMLRCAHEGVIDILDAGLSAQLAQASCPTKYVNYFVMPLAERGELFRLLFVTGRFSEPLARFFLGRLAKTLLHLHGENVAHRDIKTENILLWPDLTLKLVDFGFATCFDPAHPHFQDDEKVGSPSYNAPEQLDGSSQLDLKQVDVFALGVVLFEMLFSSAPFEQATTSDKYFKLFSKPDKAAFWKIYEQLYAPSKGCRHLLERMLDPNPVSRITLPEVLLHPWMQEQSLAPIEAELAGKMQAMLEVVE